METFLHDVWENSDCMWSTQLENGRIIKHFGLFYSTKSISCLDIK